MALEPSRGSLSHESSGRDSPVLRQWRNQLGGEEPPAKDKQYRKYASGIDRALTLFETALQEWADYISFLNRLLKSLQARQPNITTIPNKALVAKRLAQCLNPSLPSGVHQKTLEVYNYVFSVIGSEGLSRDLPLYLPGLAPTLSFASLSVRSPFLDLLERHLLALHPRSLRPAMKSVVLALLPGLEDETSDDFECTLKLLDRFKAAVRPAGSTDITPEHATGDDFFWQCFFLAAITSQPRRAGSLAYLARCLPSLGSAGLYTSPAGAESAPRLAQLVTSPEPGLLLRCFAAGLGDEQILVQRGFLDLLVTHLPLHSDVLQTRAKAGDLELLLRAVVGVTVRRDMSLNRRLWSWLLGPDPAAVAAESSSALSPASSPRNGAFTSRTSYFEEYGLQPLTRALLDMIRSSSAADAPPSERARPYRICLSLMDRWEIGGLVVPEVFLPIVDSVRRFEPRAASRSDFAEVLRSASVFFDGVESGLIYGELLRLAGQALGPGASPESERRDKLGLVAFILARFNVREEDMTTIHAPLAALSVLCMLEEGERREEEKEEKKGNHEPSLAIQALGIVATLVELVPERAFLAVGPDKTATTSTTAPAPAATVAAMQPEALAALSNVEAFRRIRDFYVDEQGNLDATPPPFAPDDVAALLLAKACALSCRSLDANESGADIAAKSRILALLASKVPPPVAALDSNRLLSALRGRLASSPPPLLAFGTFSAALSLATHLRSTGRVSADDLSAAVPLLVNHAWRFLAASEPKYHVETVRSLWLLQSALPPRDRTVEASLCRLMLAAGSIDPGRRFAVLWSHSLQDSPPSSTRLAGADSYDLMLTRPLFLMLDALADDRSQLFMTTKAWLHGLTGIDKLFRVLAAKFLELPFLRTQRPPVDGESSDRAPIQFTADDDLDLGLYYLATLSNVLRWAPDSLWAVLSSKTLSSPSDQARLSEFAGSDDVTLQRFFLQVCLRCIGSGKFSDELQTRASQLCRCALTVMHQILLNPYADHLADLHLEFALIGRLGQSLEGPDPYVQVLLLDVVFASLKLREAEVVPTSPTHKRTVSSELQLQQNQPQPNQQNQQEKNSQRPSLSGEEIPPRLAPPPPSLLKCIQAGLSAPSSRPVLDSWVGFLTECLPLYSDSIFQVLIPLVETLCGQIASVFADLKAVFRDAASPAKSLEKNDAPETTLISLLNGLEQVLARAHDRLLAEEARAHVANKKSPDQPQGFFGTMVSGVFSSDAPQPRSATANDRLTVLLAFQDAVRICFVIWSWGQGESPVQGSESSQDPSSAASFGYTSLRMRNRARRLLEHLFAAETLESLETVIGIWEGSSAETTSTVLTLLPALDGSRPRHTIPALFNALYSRTNPAALEPSRRSTLTVELRDADVAVFLVDYARSLEDDAMDEIWQDCVVFLRDLLANPFPHRQTLPSLLEFTAVLGEKVDNTNFGEQRKTRRELADLFHRLLTAIFTTRPSIEGGSTDDKKSRTDDIVGILSTIVPDLPKILVEPDRVLTAATAISTHVVAPTFRAKSFPDNVGPSTLLLLHELSRLPGGQQKAPWKKDVGDAFNEPRFFASDPALARRHWLPLLRQWAVAGDEQRLPEMLARITPPTTAGIVFGVGATSARLDADRRTQLSLRRVAALILAAPADALVADLPAVLDKLVELLAATATSSPSSTTRADLYMLVRALVLRADPVHLAAAWPVVSAELHAAISSVAAPDHSRPAETYNNSSVLQACKLLDLLVCAAPDDFQLHQWLFVTDTIDAVYRSSTYQPVALADELSEELGSEGAGAATATAATTNSASASASTFSTRKPLIGSGPGCISDDVGLERRDELVGKVLRPFFGQLSIFAFESVYAMGPPDWEACEEGLLRDLFDERTIIKAL